ncbi:MAG: beta-ketoacyl-ACP synthase [Alphaproteobacteria bacterium]|nr:beta-ketoacyl-ACP synthase [Alphaproteobacteria bacterium]
MKITLPYLGLVCALGASVSEVYGNLKNMTYPKFKTRIADGKEIPFGAAEIQNKKQMRCYDLIDCALDQIKENINELKQKYSSDRLGIVLGSSNTGIHEAQQQINKWIETGYCPSEFSFDEIELGTPAIYLKDRVGFSGPAYTVSTACSSSAKAFSSARNLIKEGICDAVLVGGADACCDFALNGFYALEALSDKQTNPFSKNRTGINLGEGAALFIMEKDVDGIELLGVGETSDGYHLTHPDPEGKGALMAMQQALSDAKLSPEQVDYINLHGTGTMANDDMESKAVYQLFGKDVLCASTKPLTGHALGAAGAIETALCWLMIKHNFIIPHVYDGIYDDTLPPINLAKSDVHKEIHTVLSNSFAFGGSNASVILKG